MRYLLILLLCASCVLTESKVQSRFPNGKVYIVKDFDFFVIDNDTVYGIIDAASPGIYRLQPFK
ncbi:hypothetical protein [Chondrinema litorale]|uniref:hypothetical protein n=1 Tax=Chondrinema litorale TaxID=2994555 RepID=UPI002542A423|nr:hypothetical protein [Chondrinema litorale]UZS00274.1 hypothetical protein OQ292_40750 [Chondrinema litorale]